MALKEKERLFALEYIKNPGNAYQAALAAGYKKGTAANAYEWLLETLTNPNAKRHLPYKPELAAFIKEELDKKEKALIADGDEVLKYLSSVMRGQTLSEVVVVENIGDYMSEARRMKKAPDEKERLKAAELLGKANLLFTDKVQHDLDLDLNIRIDYGEDDEDIENES